MSADDDADDLSDSISVDAGAADTPSGSQGLDLDALDLDLASMNFGNADDTDVTGSSGDDLSDSIDFSSAGDGDGALDLDVAELTAQLEAYETSGRRMPSLDASVGGDDAFEIESIEAIAVAEAPVGEAAVADAPVASTAASSAPAVAKPAFDFSNLALAPMDGAAEPASTAAASTGAADAAPVMQPTAAGAVVILAGLGGPDAVRQLLSSLPEQLSVPVLLYQHLDVGKHERLVDQLAKISRLPVQLAREGASPAAGTVWLLPANMTAGAHGDSLVFEPGVLAQLIAALPPEGSMVVVLSGADPQLVPMILEMGEAGGLVLAQDPEVCFDAAAAEAMQRQGAAVYPALGLARQIATRWPVAA
jgi:chemotaxis response regulator CheB